MLDNEESNNKSMRMNTTSIICDKNQSFIFKNISEECFELYSFENLKTDVKGVLKYIKTQYISRLNKMHYYLQKNIMFNTCILRR